MDNIDQLPIQEAIAAYKKQLARQRQQLEDYAMANIQDRQELAACQVREKVLRDALENHQNQTRPIQKTIEALAKTVDLAGLAREAVLREKLAFAIELIDDYYAHEKREFLAVLAQPSDDSALKAALAAERERCAKLCDMVAVTLDTREMSRGAFAVAEAIRALGD